MKYRKFIHILFTVLMLASLLAGNISFNVSAMPMSPTDETKVPHYFGPYPNWANSPFTLPDAQVVITGNGTGATAEATVGANGVITGITVTNPGQRLFECEGRHHSGPGRAQRPMRPSSRRALSSPSRWTTPGAGYTAPVVTFSGSGRQRRSATAYGGVDQVT